MKETNKEGAVGYFIDAFLDDPEKYIELGRNKKREQQKNLKTVKADNFHTKEEIEANKK